VTDINQIDYFHSDSQRKKVLKRQHSDTTMRPTAAAPPFSRAFLGFARLSAAARWLGRLDRLALL